MNGSVYGTGDATQSVTLRFDTLSKYGPLISLLTGGPTIMVEITELATNKLVWHGVYSVLNCDIGFHNTDPVAKMMITHRASGKEDVILIHGAKRTMMLASLLFRHMEAERDAAMASPSLREK